VAPVEDGRVDQPEREREARDGQRAERARHLLRRREVVADRRAFEQGREVPGQVAGRLAVLRVLGLVSGGGDDAVDALL